MEMLINGELIGYDAKINVLNPFNNDVVDTVPDGNLEHIKKAIIAANNAKNDLNDMSARKISEALYDISQEISEKLNDFSKLITLETGKPISAAKDEVKRSVDTFKFAAEESKRIYGESIPLDAGIGGKGFLGFSIKIPLGVVGAITPFNYPLNLAIHKIAPALAAKNTVVLKPSLSAPLTAIELSKIVADYFPKGAMNVVTGKGSVIGDELVSSDLVNKISFTGSVAVGKRISQKAGMKKITLELGGNDPLIILEDANLDEAVLAAVRGSYLFAGQVCIAVKRIIVDNNIADDFVDQLTKKTLKLNVGNPLNPKTDVGPLIDSEAAAHVENVVADAINHGAQLLCGGEREGNIYMPTVLDYVKMEMDVVNNETFGPISPIIRVNGVGEAIKVANNTQYGLQAGIYTKNIHNALKAAKEIESGSVMVNKQSTFRTDNMPFGGFKMSGVGKEGLKYAIEDMTRTKLIVLNTN